MLNSDMSSELLLSDILNKSGGILSKNWFYSTELHVFETQWVFRPALLLFPDNWHYARTFALIVSLIILILCILIFAYSFDFLYYGFWISAFCVWPFSYWHRFLVTYGLHYIPYTIFILLTIFCVLKLFRLNYSTHKRAVIIYTIIMIIISFCSGLNGIRQFMACFAPLLLASLIMVVLKDEEGNYISRQSIKLFVISLVAFIANVLGYFVNLAVLSHSYEFTSQDDHVWGGGTGSFIHSIRWFFEQFGYCQDWQMGIYDNTNVPLFSQDGICLLAGYVVGVVVFLSMIYLLIIFKKLDFVERFLVVLTFSMLFVIGFILTYFFAITSQYWEQNIPFGFLMVCLAIKHLPAEFQSEYFSKVKRLWNYRKSIALCVVMVFVIISSRGVTRSYGINPNPEYVKPGLVDVVSWIEENTDYTIGASEFWTSNIITEISSGRIEMYTVIDGYSPNEIYRWLQKQSHVDDYINLNHYFVLCEYDKERYVPVLNGYGNSREIYNDGKYVVYGVDK